MQAGLAADNINYNIMTLPGIIRSFIAGALLIFPTNAISQTDTLKNAADPDTTLNEESAVSLYSLIGYGSNMIYLGSTISQDQPYGYGSVTLGIKDAFYATVSAVHLANINPFTSFYIGSLNYSHAFNTWIDISAGAYRYQVTPSLTDSLFNSFWYGDLTLGIDWRLLYTRLSAGSMLAGDNMAFFQVKNSRNFKTPGFTKKKVYFTFDPYINILFGPLTSVESNSDTIIITTYPYHSGGYGQGSGSGTTTGTGSYTQTITSTDYSTKFGIMEIDFGLPVAFNSSRLTIEAEPGYVLPMHEDMNYPGLKGFVFTITCYIRIF